MKHYSGIDYDHFLDDIRDMYPFSIDEAVVVELIANALDAKTSLLDIQIDPEQRIFEITDTGAGMDSKGFVTYHNFSSSFKRKGQGIGFAGLGAKLALKIADRIVTETRQKEPVLSAHVEGLRRRAQTNRSSKEITPGRRRKSKHFWGASEWKFERRRSLHQPVWYDIEERTLTHHGTKVRIHLKHATHDLLKVDAVKRMILAHYAPVLLLDDFYASFRLYGRITILVNGEVLEVPRQSPVEFKEFILRRGRSSKPFALARFELHDAPFPEDRSGIAISTFGKIIKREWFKQYFSAMDRVTGIIEVPELVECLTTSKCDFRKEGTAGKKYYRFTKLAQNGFRRWLEDIQLIEKKEQSTDKTVQKLQRVINRIVGEIPDLQQFYGFRTTREVLMRDPEGGLTGAKPEVSPHTPDGEKSEEASGQEEQLIQKALEQAARGGNVLDTGGELEAVKKLRNVKFGPTIHYVEAFERSDISWMEGDMVLINTAHPTYRKAVDKKVQEYHNLFAVAIAMLREVPTAQEKLELLEKFMSAWGRME